MKRMHLSGVSVPPPRAARLPPAPSHPVFSSCGPGQRDLLIWGNRLPVGVLAESDILNIFIKGIL